MINENIIRSNFKQMIELYRKIIPELDSKVEDFLWSFFYSGFRSCEDMVQKIEKIKSESLNSCNSLNQNDRQ